MKRAHETRLMKRALIGHTGFVGGTLHRAAAFDACFNSSNIEAIAHQSFDLVICAGVSAVKWQANQAPGPDRAAIDRLMAALDRAEIAELVLISTIDVYPAPDQGGDEDTPIDPALHHPYGRHRYELERRCTARFPRLTVLRLPALFGPGLRKNVIFDLLHHNRLDSINPAAVFQWYPLARLWSDIAIARREQLPLVNLFPEPLPTQTIIAAAFPHAAIGPSIEPAPRYDMQTRHASLFGGRRNYLMDASSVMTDLSAFAREHAA